MYLALIHIHTFQETKILMVRSNEGENPSSSSGLFFLADASPERPPVHSHPSVSWGGELCAPTRWPWLLLPFGFPLTSPRLDGAVCVFL